jgi:hypothetical protein
MDLGFEFLAYNGEGVAYALGRSGFPNGESGLLAEKTRSRAEYLGGPSVGLSFALRTERTTRGSSEGRAPLHRAE